MSNEITTHRVQRFFDGITILAQQKMSRLRPIVRNENGISAKQAFFDQIGSTSMQEKTVRHADTPIIEIPHRRRAVTMKSYETADLVGKHDLNTVINDPTSSYGQVMAMAAGRKVDEIITDQFFGTASTGESGTGTAAWPAGSFEVASGSVGLTIAKVLAAKRVLDANENDPSVRRHAVVTAMQVEDLLNTTEIASSDFNTVKALAQGEISSYCGFNFTRYEGLPKTVNDRNCPFFLETSMVLAFGIDVTGQISDRPDKSHDTQIYYSFRAGATRMDETGVIKVLSDES
tara:strand:- start:15158 stop:16024 length:867 start_codon:yes stop_codon:yes gene_type:complete